MLSFFEDNIFFSQGVKLKKRYSNDELKYYQYFYEKTKVYPEHVIMIKKFIFFFVNNEDYFKSKIRLSIGIL